MIENSWPAPATSTPPDALEGVRILLDCRWLGRGGAGRVTEMLLDELARARPGGTWRLWGDASRLAQYRFHGASIAPWSGNPTSLFGQADLLRVPANDIAIYLHQIRPLRPGRAITFVLDTIPVRFESRRAVRWAKRLFLWVTCRLSTRVITISDWSRDSIVRDLRVATSKIVVTGLGVDTSRATRIRALRKSSPRGDHVLFVGRFAEHKNLRRLCRAFQETAVHKRGGRLILVGGTPKEIATLSAFVDRENLGGLDIRGECTERELDHLLATCLALVQPSVEEGYGLPAVEAAAAGVQVAASPTGFAPHIRSDLVSRMDALDERSIASAIDQATLRAASPIEWQPPSTLGKDVLAAVTQLAPLGGSRTRGLRG